TRRKFTDAWPPDALDTCPLAAQAREHSIGFTYRDMAFPRRPLHARRSRIHLTTARSDRTTARSPIGADCHATRTGSIIVSTAGCYQRKGAAEPNGNRKNCT